jgi:transcriptional regulator with XRE-family HTH domain
MRRSSSFQQEREALGTRLREFRQRTGLTGKQLAEGLGWDPAKISKIETGKQTASEEDLQAWLQVVAVPEEVARELLSRLRAVHREHVTWRQLLRDGGTVARQREFSALEQQAQQIRAFEPVLIPGLLQTAEYARYRLAEAMTVHGGPDDIEQGVAARMQRQQVLYDTGKRFQFLITEAALRYGLCPVEVMRRQVDRLLAMVGLSNVEFRIIPLGTPLPTAPLVGFWVFDEELVVVEMHAASVRLRNLDEVALHLKIFDLLWGVARSGDDARALLRGVLEELSATDS